MASSSHCSTPTRPSCWPSWHESLERIDHPSWPRAERIGMERFFQQVLSIQTRGRELRDVTRRIADCVGSSGVRRGICQVFIRHTSASLLISENADPDVLTDMETFFSDLVRDGDPRFIHRAEGPDDMSAHVRSALTQTDLMIPIAEGCLALGTWQGIYLWEHRAQAHQRQLIVSIFSPD